MVYFLKPIMVLLLLFPLCMTPSAAQHPARCAHFHSQVHALGARSGDEADLRGDTIDILKYKIALDMTKMNNALIMGACTIDLQSKMEDVAEITLDLLQLEVDSVIAGDTHLPYQHVQGKLRILFPEALTTEEHLQLTVHYHGIPAQDATFGGFYFQNNHAYNIGVGFDANPHNFGRAWFPCFDNFTERSEYELQVLTNNGRRPYAGGERISVQTVGQDSLLTTWLLTEQIPTYLASIAVSNYTEVVRPYESITGDTIPVYLVAQAGDSSAMKQSFINLHHCTAGFEDKLGPYRWPRIGFVAVPFFSGAMEHATNIAYPRFAIDGTLSYETLYAHELAHHWFGNLITCRTAEDMWINEGWSSYCEALFLEHQYGQPAYRDEIRNKHKESFHHAHREDGGRYPVSGVPTELTYGTHVYIKGAVMAHNLRGYMGDEAFFTALQALMEEYQFSDVSSEDLRDFMQLYTDADLSAFFNDWIFREGYPEFRIRSAQAINDHQWNITVEQYQHYNPELYTHVPMLITAQDSQGNRYHERVVLSGESTQVTMTVPSDFVPNVFFLNTDEAIAHAVFAEEKQITTSALQQFHYAEAGISVANNGGASQVFVRVENHFAPADANQSQQEFFFSPDRWWYVYHDGNADAAVHGLFSYYGNPNENKFYDPLFFEYLENNGLNENDIIMVYRPTGHNEWQEVPEYYVQTASNPNNWLGNVAVMNLIPGEYAWAVRTNSSGITPKKAENLPLYFNGRELVFTHQHEQLDVIVLDANGRLVTRDSNFYGAALSLSHLAPGAYHAAVLRSNGEMHTLHFIKP
ncbi:MAG TPA: M1 family metallopeptidase [Flavobacteriales bacterium]